MVSRWNVCWLKAYCIELCYKSTIAALSESWFSVTAIVIGRPWAKTWIFKHQWYIWSLMLTIHTAFMCLSCHINSENWNNNNNKKKISVSQFCNHFKDTHVSWILEILISNTRLTIISVFPWGNSKAFNAVTRLFSKGI